MTESFVIAFCFEGTGPQGNCSNKRESLDFVLLLHSVASQDRMRDHLVSFKGSSSIILVSCLAQALLIAGELFDFQRLPWKSPGWWSIGVLSRIQRAIIPIILYYKYPHFCTWYSDYIGLYALVLDPYFCRSLSAG